MRSDLSEPPHSPDEFEDDGLVRRVAVFDRPYVSQWVVYEQPAFNDEGPVIAGEIEVEQLELLKESGDD